MKKITTWQQVATVILLVSALVACGQKGDLYLPEVRILTVWLG